jgi:hypothetical protein
MQLSWLRSSALALLLVACGDDSGGGDGETQDDASVTETPKGDSGIDSGRPVGSDGAVTDLKDSSAADTGTKPPVADSGTTVPGSDSGVVADAGVTTDAGGATTPDAGAATPDAGSTATGESFAKLYSDIFSKKCTTTCHTATATSGLRMDSAASMYTSLGKPTGTDMMGSPGSVCAAKMPAVPPRLTPGDPSKSLIYLMVTTQFPCGKQMPPPDNGPKLSDAEQGRIRDWVAQGAKNN